MKKHIGIQLLIIIIFFTQNITAQTTELYRWNSLPFGGGGFVSGILTCKTQRHLIYVRTDVGGAYRLDSVTGGWIPLTDWVSVGESGYLGIESFAIDPNSPNKLYMLAGISYINTGKTAILRSNDFGQTFTVTDVSSQFKAHANGMGRQNGEKLQVDPNNGSILFCGTRRNGLFKSIDSGATWNRLASLNVTTTPNDNGISFVLMDADSVFQGKTQCIIIGVSRTGENLYLSTDGGQTFTSILNAPSDLMPQRAALDGAGNLFITYGNGAGPHAHYSLTNEPFDKGAVWKYNITTGDWTNITPPGFTRPFGGISIDPNNSNRIVVSTINTYLVQQSSTYGDRFLLSTNGGSSWIDVVARGFKLDPNGYNWIINNAIHWSGSIEFDPFNTKRVFVTSGNGIFITENIDSTTNVWKFCAKGLEETVPLDMISMPGGQAIAVVGDYDGYIYKDNTCLQLTSHVGTMTSIAYAAKNPQMVIRVGARMHFSTDTGKTWTQCTINGQNGLVAISADGNTFMHSPDGSTTTYYSKDKGTTWSAVSGLGMSNARSVADPVNNDKFYSYAPNTGTIYVSTDGGLSFSYSGTPGLSGSKNIRTVPGYEGHIWVALYDGGLTRSTNSGQSFIKITNVKACSAVGIGKAAPGANYPTLYIWGTIDSIEGIYRSIDEGVSWVRINDDLHEYGGPGNGQFVIGDMNFYGRVYMSTLGRGVVYGELLYDCAGIKYGNAYFDDCDSCVSGTTGKVDCKTTTEVINIEKHNSFSYSPNPFKNSLHFQVKYPSEYEIFSITGTSLESGFCKKNSDIATNLKSGIYLMTIRNSKEIRTIKIIKN
jgi:xyloglucan-specific exo-beta-1,4-glucanase